MFIILYNTAERVGHVTVCYNYIVFNHCSQQLVAKRQIAFARSLTTVCISALTSTSYSRHCTLIMLSDVYDCSLMCHKMSAPCFSNTLCYNMNTTTCMDVYNYLILLQCFGMAKQLLSVAWTNRALLQRSV